MGERLQLRITVYAFFIPGIFRYDSHIAFLLVSSERMFVSCPSLLGLSDDSFRNLHLWHRLDDATCICKCEIFKNVFTIFLCIQCSN